MYILSAEGPRRHPFIVRTPNPLGPPQLVDYVVQILLSHAPGTSVAQVRNEIGLMLRDVADAEHHSRVQHGGCPAVEHAVVGDGGLERVAGQVAGLASATPYLGDGTEQNEEVEVVRKGTGDVSGAGFLGRAGSITVLQGHSGKGTVYEPLMGGMCNFWGWPGGWRGLICRRLVL